LTLRGTCSVKRIRPIRGKCTRCDRISLILSNRYCSYRIVSCQQRLFLREAVRGYALARSYPILQLFDMRFSWGVCEISDVVLGNKIKRGSSPFCSAIVDSIHSGSTHPSLQHSMAYPSVRHTKVRHHELVLPPPPPMRSYTWHARRPHTASRGNINPKKLTLMYSVQPFSCLYYSEYSCYFLHGTVGPRITYYYSRTQHTSRYYQ
jgi:hypothetical protein